VHLVGFIIRIYHDTRTPERQIPSHASGKVLYSVGALSPEVKCPGTETGHSRLSSAEGKISWSYNFTPPYILNA